MGDLATELGFYAADWSGGYASAGTHANWKKQFTKINYFPLPKSELIVVTLYALHDVQAKEERPSL